MRGRWKYVQKARTLKPVTPLRKALVHALYLLIVLSTPLLAQIEAPIKAGAKAAGSAIGDAAAHSAGKDIAVAAKKDTAVAAKEDTLRQTAEAWTKYQEEERKFYERYSTADREYFGWFSAIDLKKPFNQLVDDAIVSMRAKSGAMVFKNAGNQQIVEVLSAESHALPPPSRLNLELQQSWYKPDTLEVTRPGSAESATVRMGSLKDYISDAIDRLKYPPQDPSKVVVHPIKGDQPLQVVPVN